MRLCSSFLSPPGDRPRRASISLSFEFAVDLECISASLLPSLFEVSLIGSKNARPCRMLRPFRENIGRQVFSDSGSVHSKSPADLADIKSFFARESPSFHIPCEADLASCLGRGDLSFRAPLGRRRQWQTGRGKSLQVLQTPFSLWKKRSRTCRKLCNKCHRSATFIAPGAPSVIARAYSVERSRATISIPG